MLCLREDAVRYWGCGAHPFTQAVVCGGCQRAALCVCSSAARVRVCALPGLERYSLHGLLLCLVCVVEGTNARLPTMLGGPAAARAVTIADQARRRQLVQEFVAKYARQGLWRDCLVALQDARDNHVPISSMALAPAIRAAGVDGRNFDVAMWLYRDAHKLFRIGERCVEAHHAILDAATIAGNWQFAMRVVTRAALDANWRAIKNKEATEDEARMAVVDVDARMLEKVLRVCVERDHWVACLTAFSVFRRPHQAHEIPRAMAPPSFIDGGPLMLTTTLPYVTPPDITPGALAAVSLALARATRWEGALKLMAACSRQGISAPPVAYNNAIRACFFSQKHRHVVALAKQMADSAVAIEENVTRMAIRSCEDVAHNYGAASGAWALSCRLFSALAGQGLPLVRQTYVTPFRTCIESGAWVQALQLADEMRRDGFPVPASTNEAVLAARVSRSSTTKEAQALADIADKPHSRPARVYDALIEVGIRTKRFGYARKQLSLMRQHEVRGTYRTYELRIELEHAERKWTAVLREFLAFKVRLDEDAETAAKHGFKTDPADYDVREALIPLIAAACNGLGPQDAVAVAVMAYLKTRGVAVWQLEGLDDAAGKGRARGRQREGTPGPMGAFINVP